jgi:hypothetical protein
MDLLRGGETMENVEALKRLSLMATAARSVNFIYDPSENGEAIGIAIEALRRQIPRPVSTQSFGGYSTIEFRCPVCDKRQNGTRKNRLEGCFCERCGQRLRF